MVNKKLDWSLVILPLIMVWVLDAATKNWALTIQQIISFGFINLTLHLNPGAMLGLFIDLPKILRVVTLSTGGAFLLFVYAAIQYLLPSRLLPLRIGLSFLIGGILGNVTDRILWGHVVDFIYFGFGKYASPIFNLADLFQWVGYGLIVFGSIKDRDLLWPEYDTRQRIWVNFTFQIKYSLMLVFIGLSLTVIYMVFSYTYLKVSLIEFVGNNPYTLNKFLVPFLYTYGLVCLIFCGILFFLGRFISHRIAGPMFAFEKFLTNLVSGNPTPMRLRSKDEFRHFEDLANAVYKHYKELKENGQSPEPPADLDLNISTILIDENIDNEESETEPQKRTQEE
ncbi:MAG TPA: signal peptidase II [Pseudobdellovibrionaceae bacterium]|nr:signal peptidase II [Pseudobdellovibrionaceae bacterium]